MLLLLKLDLMFMYGFYEKDSAFFCHSVSKDTPQKESFSL